MRSVMRDWLKAVFVLQSFLSVVVCGAVAYDTVPFFPHLDIAVRVLGELQDLGHHPRCPCCPRNPTSHQHLPPPTTA